MRDSQRKMRMGEAAGSLLSSIKWVSVLMLSLILYGLYAFIQARHVVQSEPVVVDQVFVTKAAWMDRVGISIKGERYFLFWEFPLSPGEGLILEKRGNGELYVCQMSRDRCSRIRRL